MKRREFVGGLAATWSFAVHAQQPERMRRIGVLVAYAEADPEIHRRLMAFREGLERLGWSEGRNVRIDVRFAPAGAGQEELRARELVGLQPDVILAHSPRSSQHYDGRPLLSQPCSWGWPIRSKPA